MVSNPNCTRFPAAQPCRSKAVGLHIDGAHLVSLLRPCRWASAVCPAALNQPECPSDSVLMHGEGNGDGGIPELSGTAPDMEEFRISY